MTHRSNMNLDKAPDPLRVTSAGRGPGPLGGLSHYRGLYLLVLEAHQSLSVGRLGLLTFDGVYLYVGSAQGTAGLRRVERHFNYPLGGGPMKWHIDALLASGALRAAVVGLTEQSQECKLATALHSHLSPIFKGFGSSDCSCLSHLFRAGTTAAALAAAGMALNALGLQPYFIHCVPHNEQSAEL